MKGPLGTGQPAVEEASRHAGAAGCSGLAEGGRSPADARDARRPTRGSEAAWARDSVRRTDTPEPSSVRGRGHRAAEDGVLLGAAVTSHQALGGALLTPGQSRPRASCSRTGGGSVETCVATDHVRGGAGHGGGTPAHQPQELARGPACEARGAHGARRVHCTAPQASGRDAAF